MEDSTGKEVQNGEYAGKLFMPASPCQTDKDKQLLLLNSKYKMLLLLVVPSYIFSVSARRRYSMPDGTCKDQLDHRT